LQQVQDSAALVELQKIEQALKDLASALKPPAAPVPPEKSKWLAGVFACRGAGALKKVYELRKLRQKLAVDSHGSTGKDLLAAGCNPAMVPTMRPPSENECLPSQRSSPAPISQPTTVAAGIVKPS
jgi:hypothetical protein